ncbi:MAG: SPOR domain-containing protein [Treponema sp.]|nr:MAG: SPOR domain-containing protein [Treponema sp.]
MEQKRTLWIVAAVGVFLLVVLGAALILYTPQSKQATIANSRVTNSSTASNGWISLAPSAPLQASTNPDEKADEESSVLPEKEIPNPAKTELRAEEVNIYAENAKVYSEKTELNKLGENATVKAESSEKPTTIVLTEPEKTAEAKASKPEVSKPRSNVTVKNSVSEKQKAPAKPEHKNTAKTAKTEQNKSVSAKPSVKEPEIVQYWVQVSALTSRKSADEARNKLGENQITADVFTYTDNKKQLFYRVRVGPYTTKSEAEYWRTKISKIDSFQNSSSYITSTTVSK